MAKAKRPETCSFRIGRNYYRMQPGTNDRDHIALRAAETGAWEILPEKQAHEVATELIRRAERILIKGTDE